MRTVQTYAALVALVVLMVLCIPRAGQPDYRQLRSGLDLATPEAAAIEYVSACLSGDRQTALACGTSQRVSRLTQPLSQPEDDLPWPGPDRPIDRQQMRGILRRDGRFDCQPLNAAEVRCCCRVLVDGQWTDLVSLTLVDQQGQWLVK